MRSSLSCALVPAVLSLLALIQAPALGVYLATWDGGGLDDNLATAKNWANNATPPNDGTAELNFDGNVRPRPIATTVWDVYRLNFVGATAGFKLSGSSLNLGHGGILNGSAKGQTIVNDITLIATSLPVYPHQIWSSDPGDVTLQGDLDLQNEVVELYGTGQLRLDGTVTGINGRIEVGSPGYFSTPGNLVLGGTINVDVDTNIGTLSIDTNQPQPPYSTLQFADGTSFRALGAQSITNALQLNGDVTYFGSGVLHVEQTISGSGDLTVSASTIGVLDLGPVNNFSPFGGQVEVTQGQLELNGGGTVAQLGGTLVVGDGAGAEHTAVLRAHNPGVLAPNLPLTVHADGLIEIEGPISFASLNLAGGDLVATGAVTAEPISAGGSSSVATMDAPWSMPINGLDYDVTVTNGSANPDLDLLAGCAGPGTLRIAGGGQVELRGDPAQGPGAINVMAGTLGLQRSGGASVLVTAGASNATLRILANDQLGASCEVNLLPGSTLDIGSYLEHVGHLYAQNTQIVGPGGALTLHANPNVVGTVDCEPLLVFAPSFVDINVAGGAVLTTDSASGQNMNLLGGGFWSCADLNGNLTVSSGTYRSNGLIDGDADIDDTLEIPADAGFPLDVNGTVSCGPSAALVVDLDPSGATAGQEWPLIQAQQLVGSFANVQLPPPPADLYWQVVYGPGSVGLRLETIDQARLDLTAGTNGQDYAFPEVVEGVLGIDFTPLGFDDLALCTVAVDSVWSPLSDSMIGVRLYQSSNQQLLASADDIVSMSTTPSEHLFQLPVLLQPGDAYRLVLYAANVSLRSYEPGLPFPYPQSSLVQINGAYLTSFLGDVFPTAPHGRLPHVRIDLGPCGATTIGEPTPQARELSLGLHPNPFNPRTTIQFDLPRDGRVQVDVFDARGRHVGRLLDEDRAAGTFDLEWAGTDGAGHELGSGVYFVRLLHAAGARVTKTTLLR